MTGFGGVSLLFTDPPADLDSGKGKAAGKTDDGYDEGNGFERDHGGSLSDRLRHH